MAPYTSLQFVWGMNRRPWCENLTAVITYRAMNPDNLPVAEGQAYLVCGLDSCDNPGLGVPPVLLYTPGGKPYT